MSIENIQQSLNKHKNFKTRSLNKFQSFFNNFSNTHTHTQTLPLPVSCDFSSVDLRAVINDYELMSFFSFLS